MSEESIISKYKTSRGVPWNEVTLHEARELVRAGKIAAALLGAELQVAQAECDEVDNEMAAISAGDPEAEATFLSLTERRRAAGERFLRASTALRNGKSGKA